MEEEEHNPAPKPTDKQAAMLWQAMKNDRNHKSRVRGYDLRPLAYTRYAATARCYTQGSAQWLTVDQLESGLKLHACAMTEEGEQLLHLRVG